MGSLIPKESLHKAGLWARRTSQRPSFPPQGFHRQLPCTKTEYVFSLLHSIDALQILRER